MNEYALDEVDRGILFALQRDARNTTIQDMAAEVDVSASTVRNRIEQLEEAGIIEGYYPKINYERANFPLHVLFVCSTTTEKREELSTEALETPGVVAVRELLTGSDNIHIEAVATGTRDLTTITNDLSDLGFTVESSEIITNAKVRPWGEFEF